MTEQYKEYYDEGQERDWKTPLEILMEQEEKRTKQAVIRSKLVEMLQDPEKSTDGEGLSEEDANWLIDNAGELDDDELGDCINPTAVIAFRQLVAYIQA